MATSEAGVRGFMSPFDVPAPEGCEGWESMYPDVDAAGSDDGAGGVAGATQVSAGLDRHRVAGGECGELLSGEPVAGGHAASLLRC